MWDVSLWRPRRSLWDQCSPQRSEWDGLRCGAALVWRESYGRQLRSGNDHYLPLRTVRAGLSRDDIARGWEGSLEEQLRSENDLCSPLRCERDGLRRDDDAREWVDPGSGQERP